MTTDLLTFKLYQSQSPMSLEAAILYENLKRDLNKVRHDMGRLKEVDRESSIAYRCDAVMMTSSMFGHYLRCLSLVNRHDYMPNIEEAEYLGEAVAVEDFDKITSFLLRVYEATLLLRQDYPLLKIS